MAICMSVSGYFRLKIEEGSTEGNWVRFLIINSESVTHPTTDRAQLCFICVIVGAAQLQSCTWPFLSCRYQFCVFYCMFAHR